MAVKKVIELSVDTKNAVDSVDDLQEAIQGVNTELKNVDDNSGESLNGVAQNSKKAEKGVKRVGTAFKGLGLAIKAIGIGLVLKAFDTLSTLLGENQKVLDFFNTSFNVVSIAFRDFTNLIFNNFGKVSEFISNAFSIQGIKNFGEAIKNNVIERFQSLLDFVGLAGEAFKEFFSGNFAIAAQKATEASKEFVDVITGVDGSYEKGKKLITDTAEAVVNYTKEVVKAAEANTQLRNDALLAAAINQGLIEQYDRQAEQLRQIRDDESLTIQERIAANEELARVLDEQEKLLLANVDIQIAAAQADLDRNNNIENQVALIEAQNEKLAVQAQIEGFRSEQLINVNSLLREQAELEKQKTDDAEANAKKIAEAEKKAADERIAIEKAVTDAKDKLLSDSFALTIDVLGKTSAAGKAVGIAQATINTYQGVTEVWKTPSVLPEPLATIQRVVSTATVLASGLAAVKSITSQQLPSIAKGGGGVSASGGGGLTPASPSFNVVGQSETNQLAQTVAQDRNEPIRAYVVASEVTTQQSLDRNIINTASFG